MWECVWYRVCVACVCVAVCCVLCGRGMRCTIFSQNRQQVTTVSSGDTLSAQSALRTPPHLFLVVAKELMHIDTHRSCHPAHSLQRQVLRLHSGAEDADTGSEEGLYKNLSVRCRSLSPVRWWTLHVVLMIDLCMPTLLLIKVRSI